VRGNWRWLRAREESAPQDFPPRAGHLQGPIQNERGNREGKREGACRQGPIQIERGNRERNRERAQDVQGPIQIERGNRDGKRGRRPPAPGILGGGALLIQLRPSLALAPVQQLLPYSRWPSSACSLPLLSVPIRWPARSTLVSLPLPSSALLS